MPRRSNRACAARAPTRAPTQSELAKKAPADVIAGKVSSTRMAALMYHGVAFHSRVPYHVKKWRGTAVEETIKALDGDPRASREWP
ncbi:MAG: hypothetical protein SGPRY_003506 [Prymnesium sp.]